MGKTKYQMDMCHGSLPRKIFIFTVPLVFTGILQLLFNAADLMVLGQFAPVQAMAAVGATLSMHSLIINIFMGTAIGANVVAGNFYGAKDYGGMRRTVHTAIIFAFFGGLGVMAAGLLVGRYLLQKMNTPANIIDDAWLYTWICFCGIPFIVLYNYGCALLRAVGDTKRPLYILIAAGILNVVLNVILVRFCNMSVAGVALATVASHILSAALVMRLLIKNHGACRFNFKWLCFDFKILWKMLIIGIPSGIGSSCFSIANMIIQAAVNSFGELAVAGRTAVQSMEGICYIAGYAFSQSAISFVAQNLGGGKYKRIVKSAIWCTVFAVIFSGILGIIFNVAGEYAIRIFAADPEVISWGLIGVHVLCSTYAICAVMDVPASGLRGLGMSIVATINSLFGACLFRIFWILWILPYKHTMTVLLLSYPASWILTALINWSIFLFITKKMMQNKIKGRTTLMGMKPGIPKGIRFFNTK